MGIAESLQEKWESVLQWSDENNLPLRGISDGLEEKGIPALPFFILLVLLLVGGILYFTVFKSAGGDITLFPATKANVLVTLRDAIGQPVANAQITIASTNGDQTNLKETTDSGGEALFRDLKIGSTFEVSVSDSQGNALQLEDATFSVLKGTKEIELALSAPTVTDTVSVSVEVTGPTDPATVRVAIAGSDGFPIGSAQTGSLTARFSALAPNSEYVVQASAEGFITGQTKVKVEDRDIPIAIALKSKERETIGTIKVLVLDAETQKPLKDANVDITESETGSPVYSKWKTGENGYTKVDDATIGKLVKVVASLKGYTPAETEIAIIDETKVTLELSKIPEAELKSIKVIVKDAAGGQLPNPIIKLFNSKNTKIAESNPSDGIGLFNSVSAEEYYVTIFKPGYVPSFVKSATRGNTYEVKLEEATTANTAKLKVQVETQNEEAVPQASVALFNEDGLPLGTVDRISGNDGIASYEELPLIKIYAKAAFGGRNGESGLIELTSEGTGEEPGINLLKVILKPAKGRGLVAVKDHFSGKSIENAKVEFAKSDVDFKPVGSCTTKTGKCSVSLQEGFYIAQITASGYDALLTSEFEIKPNIDNKNSFELISSQIADKTKIIFNGMFNLKGESVSSLSPSSTYNAKFTITRPRVKITKAEVQVRIGNPGSLDTEVAQITGYDAAGGYVTKGATSERPESPILSSEAPSPSALPSPSPSPNPSTSLTLAGKSNIVSFASSRSAAPSSPSILNFADGSSASTGSLNFANEPAGEAYKYVNFELSPFEGSKEISVQIQTRSVASGKVDLQYRSVFYTQNEVLRDPADESADRLAFLANMNSKVFAIEYEGKCENGICSQVHFEGNSGSSENNFEAQINENFKLKFKLVAPKGTTVEFSAPLNDQTIALTGGSSGEAKATIKTTEDTQISSITTPEENAEGEFDIQGRRLANNVDFQFKVVSGENLIERTLSVRIVGQKPDLRVTYTVVSDKSGGKVLKALKDNKLIFTVTDSQDIPLKNAYVTLGSGVDALGGLILEASPQEAKDVSLTYVFEGVSPPGVGSAAYKVTAEGFKEKKGTIPVLATTLVSVDAKALSLSLDSQEGRSAPFSVQNLLSNEVRLSYALLFLGKEAQYTDISLESTSAKLKSADLSSNNLKAILSDALLKIASKPETLSEKITGRVRIVAKLGSTVQEESLPFVVDSRFEQLDFNKLWTISENSANFALQPPKLASGEQVITITNDAPYPILINHQSKTKGIAITPLTIVIQPSETGEFTIKASASNIDECRFEESLDKGKLEFIASSNGIISRRSLASEVSVSSSENCRLKDGARLQFPSSLTLSLPVDTKTKYNNDGSLFIQIPSGEKFVFDSGAQIANNPNEYVSSIGSPAFAAPSKSSGNYIVIPAGVFIEVPPAYVKQNAPIQKVAYSGYDASTLPASQRALATSSWQVSFPFPSFIDFDPQTEFSQDGNYRIASFEDFDMYFDISAPLVKGKSQQERRANLKANSPISIQLTPFVNSQQSEEAYFPVEATFVIQDRVRLRKDDFTGSKALQLSNDMVISLPADATFSSDPAASGGSGAVFSELRKVTIPQGSIVRIPPPYVNRGLQGELMLKLPFKVQFKVPKTTGVSLTLDQAGIGAKAITTEIYEVVFAPGTTRVGLEFADGARTIEAAANSPITIRPTDFGVVGPKRKLPIAITLNLPSSSTVKQKGGATQIEFDNGNRMLLEGIGVKEGAFEAKIIEIPANTEITFSGNNPNPGNRMIQVQQSSFGEERFILRIPTQVTFHFPIANAIVKPPNIIRNELEGYEIDFPLDRIAFQKGDNTNDVALSPLQSYSGVIFSGADKTLPGRDFEFRFNFPMAFEIPENVFLAPRLEPYNQKYSEIFQSFRFTDATDLKFGDPDVNDEFRIRATRLLSNEFDSSSADFLSDPKTFIIPPNALIVPRIQKDETGKFMLYGIFGKDLAYTLPTGVNLEDVKDTNLKFVNLKSCTQIKIQVGERSYLLPPIRSIQFPDGARIMPYDSSNAEALQQVTVRAKEEVAFELCEGKARKDVGAAVESSIRALVAFEKPFDAKVKPDVNDKIIDLEFDNNKVSLPQDAFICVQNWGFKPLYVEMRLDDDSLKTQPTLENRKGGLSGESISSDLAGAIKSITRPSDWATGPRMLIGSVDPDKQKCDAQSFKLAVGIPSKYLDEDDCIKLASETAKEYVTDPEKETFVTVFGEYEGIPAAQRIGLRIKLKKEGVCAGANAKQFSEMLGGFFVNYASGQGVDFKNARDGLPMKLHFKGPTSNHQRAFAVINNLDEDVDVSFAKVGDFVDLIGDKVFSLKSGSGRIVWLTANKVSGNDDYNDYIEVIGKGVKTGKIFKHEVGIQVFPLDPSMAKIYYSSPLGDLAPQAASADNSGNGDATGIGNSATGTTQTAGNGKSGKGQSGSGSQPDGGTTNANKQTNSPESRIVFAAESKISFVDAVPKDAANPKTDGLGNEVTPAGSQTAAPAKTDDSPVEAYSEEARKLPEAVMTCQTNFCSSAQVEDSFRGFTEEFQSYINVLSGNSDEMFTKEIGKFCSKLGISGKYEKSIVIQAANAKTMMDKGKALDIALKTFKDNGREFKVQASEVNFDGCGIYILTGSLNICTPLPATKKEWLKGGAGIEFRLISTQKEKCEETIANAPLLMAERDQVEPVIGRDLTPNGISMDYRVDNQKGGGAGITALLTGLQYLNIGPYKQKVDKIDLATINSLYGNLYLKPRTEPIGVADFYSDSSFCRAFGTKALIGTGLAFLGVGFGGVIVTAAKASSGVGAIDAINSGYILTKTLYGLPTAMSLCFTAFAQSAAPLTGSKLETCQLMNDCIYSGIAGTAEALFSAVPAGATGGMLVRKFVDETVSNIAATALIDAGVAGYNALKGTDEPIYAPVPYVYAGGKLVSAGIFRKPWGSKAYITDYLQRQGFKSSQAKLIATDIASLRKTDDLALFAKEWGFGATGTGAASISNIDGHVDAEARKTDFLDKYAKTADADGLAQIDELKSFENDLAKLKNEDRILAQAEEASRRADFRSIDRSLNRKRVELGTVSTDLAIENAKFRPDPAIVGPLASKKAILESEITTLSTRVGNADDLLRLSQDRLRTIDANIDILQKPRTGKIATARSKLVSDAKTAVKTKLKSIGNPAAINTKAATALTTAELKAKYPNLKDEQIAGIAGEYDSTTGKWSSGVGKSGKQTLKAVGRGILASLIPMLFHVDVRPVQATLDYRFPHHVVAFNDAGERPSMRNICVRKFESDDECANQLAVEPLCPKDSSIACVYLIKGRRFSTVEGYTLLTGMNKGAPTDKLLRSLFASNEAPLKESEADPSKLIVEYRASFEGLPSGVPEETVAPLGDRAAAEALYKQLWDACSVHLTCPGTVDEAFLKQMKEKITTDPKGALADMIQKSKYN